MLRRYAPHDPKENLQAALHSIFKFLRVVSKNVLSAIAPSKTLLESAAPVPVCTRRTNNTHTHNKKINNNNINNVLVNMWRRSSRCCQQTETLRDHIGPASAIRQGCSHTHTHIREFSRGDSKPKKRLRENRAMIHTTDSSTHGIALFSWSPFLGLGSPLGNSGIMQDLIPHTGRAILQPSATLQRRSPHKARTPYSQGTVALTGEFGTQHETAHLLLSPNISFLWACVARGPLIRMKVRGVRPKHAFS